MISSKTRLPSYLLRRILLDTVNYTKTIKALETEENPLSRLLRVKIELTCSEQASKDTTEFKAIQDNAKIATIAWQKEMTKLYTQAKKLDKECTQKQHTQLFCKKVTNIFECKSCFELNLMDDNSNAKK
jgi:beta-glucosidase-like glycosyl hydrolase